MTEGVGGGAAEGSGGSPPAEKVVIKLTLEKLVSRQFMKGFFLLMHLNITPSKPFHFYTVHL